MLGKTLQHQFVSALEQLAVGSFTLVLPDGKQHFFEGNEPGLHAHLHIHDWRTISATALQGDIGFADAYRNGWWDSDDLTTLFTVVLQNESALKPYMTGSFFSRLGAQLLYLLRSNSLSGSKRNIHAHYDLGNNFYRLWLDESMTYSSALFDHEQQDLLSAQHNKYDRIIERLPDSGRILEVGCGWGGFAERSLQKKDHELLGLTISQEQYDYATARLGNSANIALKDYRHQQGRYDAIVSIEMFEAVGERYWPVYFQKIKNLLNKNGSAMLQSITIADEYFQNYRSGSDAIRTFIFPGGMLPSPTRFAEESARAGLSVNDMYFFGQDYARTLQHWLLTFESQASSIKALGFDEPFMRLWRYYLTSCIASFAVGRTNVMQVELRHAA